MNNLKLLLYKHKAETVFCIYKRQCIIITLLLNNFIKIVYKFIFKMNSLGIYKTTLKLKAILLWYSIVYFIIKGKFLYNKKNLLFVEIYLIS